MAHAPTFIEISQFYRSRQWRALSYAVKVERGRRCECCGATPADGAKIVTDHIKSVKLHWHLRFTRSNLQVACENCNLGKGSNRSENFPRKRAAGVSEAVRNSAIAKRALG